MGFHFINLIFYTFFFLMINKVILHNNKSPNPYNITLYTGVAVSGKTSPSTSDTSDFTTTGSTLSDIVSGSSPKISGSFGSAGPPLPKPNVESSSLSGSTPPH